MKEDWKELIKKNLKWVVLFICLVGFLALAENVFNKEIMNGDIIGYKLISTFLISDFVTPIAKFITNFGGAIFLSIATVMLFLFIKNKKIGIILGTIIGFTLMLWITIQFIILPLNILSITYFIISLIQLLTGYMTYDNKKI